MGDTHDAEDVRLERLAHVGGHVRGAEHGVALAPRLDARVVDQYVKPALGLDGLHGGPHRRVVGDIELDGPGAQLFGGPASAFGVPAADVDRVAGDEPAGSLVGRPCSLR